MCYEKYVMRLMYVYDVRGDRELGVRTGVRTDWRGVLSETTTGGGDVATSSANT